MLGIRLKTARFFSGLTQFELGVKAGLEEESARVRISHYENDVHQPTFSLVSKLAKILDVPTAYFFTEEDELAELILKYHKLRKENPSKPIYIDVAGL